MIDDNGFLNRFDRFGVLFLPGQDFGQLIVPLTVSGIFDKQLPVIRNRCFRLPVGYQEIVLLDIAWL